MEINPNSSQTTGSSTAPNALGNVQRPGEYLRQVRINQKRELADVAKELNIPHRILVLLEQDEYKSLPEATFIKGYYRSYAKSLKVDASTIIQRFDEIYANDTGLLPNHALNNSPIKIMGKLPGSNSERNRKWLKRAAIALAVLIIFLSVVVALKGFLDDQDALGVDEQAVEVLSLDNSTVVMTGDQLSLSFSRPTSVHILDSTGKVLLTGRQASNASVTGDAPFQIRLDDAEAVSLNLNNEDISLSPYTVNGKAEFRLSR